MPKRRYEILLPLRHNDGRPVGDELVHLTRKELLERFRGLTFAPHAVQGDWKQNGQHFTDELVRVVVDVEDTEDNRRFFIEFKQLLLKRFEQLEIYIVSYSVDVL